MSTTIVRMQQRRDATAAWESNDPVLLPGEVGYDTTEKRFKIGDGTSSWTELDYVIGVPADLDPAMAALFADPGSDAATALSASTVALLGDGTVDEIRFSDDDDALVIQDTLGLDGRRLRVTPNDPAGAAGVSIELVPGTTLDPATHTPAQLLLYNQPGTDYERFTLTAHADQYLIESTYNGAGTAKDILFQVGGSVSNAVDGVNAVVIYGDASVDLQGGTFNADGKSWGATKTRIADPGNTGDSRLVVDTRTGTPASNTADSSSIEFRRGGSAKWNIGLNFSGSNADNWQVYSRQGAALMLDIGDAKMGFFGTAAVAKPTGVAVSAAGIHAALVTLGLIAA